MLYTEGDIIRAHNDGLDLFNLVLSYLKDYAEYANGANNIRLVKEEIKFARLHGVKGTPESPKLAVSCCSDKNYVAFDVFVEDNDPDYEGYGRPGHYEQSGYYDRAYTEILIPLQLLLDDRTTRIQKMSDTLLMWKKKQEEESKQKEIARLREQLEKLENPDA